MPRTVERDIETADYEIRDGEVVEEIDNTNIETTPPEIAPLEEDPPERGGFFSFLRGHGILSKASRFKKWTREELVTALISTGFEVRNERAVPLLSLCDECDRIFAKRALPLRISDEDKIVEQTDKIRRFMLNYCAAKIQNAWLSWHLRRIQDDDLESVCKDRVEKEFADVEGDEGVGREKMEIEDIDLIIGDLKDKLGPKIKGKHSSDDIGIRSEVQNTRASKMLAVLDVPWTAPSWEKAQRSADFLHPRRGGKGGVKYHVRSTNTGRHCPLGGIGEQCDLWGEGMVSEFGIYGPGLTNYFKFLKWMSWVFAMLAVITLPELIMNLYGSVSQRTSGLASLSETTVGNLANTIINGTVTISIPGCNSALVGERECQLTRDKLGMIYGIIEAVVSLFVLVAYIWLRKFERSEETTLEKNTVVASMYTVAVKNLPRECNELQLTSHFNAILGGQFPVVSVHFAHRCHREVRRCKKRGNLIRYKTRIINEHRFNATKLKETEKNPAVLEEKLIKLKIDSLLLIKKTDEGIKSLDNELMELAGNKEEPLVAFVTFEENVGAQIVKDLYKPTLFDSIYFDKRLLFKGKRLQIKMAPEPSVIIWENLEFGPWNRFARKLITMSAAVLLVLVSVGITYGAKILQLRSANSGGNSDCTASFYDLTRDEQLAAVDADPSILHCYCSQLSYTQQSDDPYCKKYQTDTFRAQFLTFFSSIVVLGVSTLIEEVIRQFVAFEKHHSEDHKERSVFLRLFLLQYLNSSCVFLINGNHKILHDVFGVKTVASKEYSADWYSTVGVSIIIVMLGNILFSQSTSLTDYFVFHTNMKKVEKVKSAALTQEELNKAHHGPQFQLSYRYAMIMASFFVTFTFSSGIPVLYAFMAVTCYTFFVVDKYCFIKLYRSPHRYSAKIGKQATLLIPLGIALHLSMSIWVLSNPEIFSSSYDSRADLLQTDLMILDQIVVKLSKRQTFPLFFLVCIILILYIAYYLFRGLLRLAKQVHLLIWGDKETRDIIAQLQLSRNYGVVIPYSKAIQRNIIKGLASYNLLQNPVYKEKFAITWGFAFKHHDVRSVMYVSSHKIQEDLDDEDDIAQVDRLIRLEAKDKEMLATLSRANEDGLIGSATPGNGSTPRAKGGPKPPLVRMTSNMQRHALMIGESADDLDGQLPDYPSARGTAGGSPRPIAAFSTDVDDHPVTNRSIELRPLGSNGNFPRTTSNTSSNADDNMPRPRHALPTARHDKKPNPITTRNASPSPAADYYSPPEQSYVQPPSPPPSAIKKSKSKSKSKSKAKGDGQNMTPRGPLPTASSHHHHHHHHNPSQQENQSMPPSSHAPPPPPPPPPPAALPRTPFDNYDFSSASDGRADYSAQRYRPPTAAIGPPGRPSYQPLPRQPASTSYSHSSSNQQYNYNSEF